MFPNLGLRPDGARPAGGDNLPQLPALEGSGRARRSFPSGRPAPVEDLADLVGVQRGPGPSASCGCRDSPQIHYQLRASKPRSSTHSTTLVRPLLQSLRHLLVEEGFGNHYHKCITRKALSQRLPDDETAEAWLIFKQWGGVRPKAGGRVFDGRT